MVSTDIIIHSFYVCGITSSDPDIINCTKLGGVAEAARESLSINNIDLASTIVMMNWKLMKNMKMNKMIFIFLLWASFTSLPFSGHK
ncbi:hypothetical protein HZS_6917 [Henneguya salminicola]|nr:hypothetical protein HZS_6917 [Henneguya salminicola]